MSARDKFEPVPVDKGDAFEIDYSGKLRGRLAHRLVVEANQRKLSPSDLLAKMIEHVLRDNLIDAVLDDD